MMSLLQSWRARMGVVLLIGAVVLFVGGLAWVPLAPTRPSAPMVSSKAVETKLASIPVEGMLCLSCAAAIKRRVKALDGVQDAQVHFAEKIVVVNYRADRPDVPAQAVAAINSLGYKARPPLGVET